MRSQTRIELRAERLENRWTPATARVLGSTLFIANPDGLLTLTFQTSDSVLINDNSLNVTLPAGNIFLIGTGPGDEIAIDTNGNDFAGEMFLNLRGGADSISIGGAGSLAGNLTVQAGDGSDTIAIANTGDLEVLGNISVLAGRGNDVISLGEGGANVFRGDVSILGGNTVTLGDTGTNTDAILGNLSVQSLREAGAISVTLESGLTTEGNVNLSTGGGADTITLASLDGTGTAFAGNLSIETGSREDLIQADPTGPQTFAGNLRVQAGDGDDSFTINDQAVVGGDALLDLGGGTNALELGAGGAPVTFDATLTIRTGAGDDVFDKATSSVSFTVGDTLTLDLGDGDNMFIPGAGTGPIGNLVVRAGSGDDTITIAEAGITVGEADVRLGDGANAISFGVTTGGGAITGDLSIDLGNGGNTISVFNSVFGDFRLNSGNGADQVTLGSTVGGEFYNLAFDLEGGDDTVTLSISQVQLTGVLDGGSGTNTLANSVAAIILPPFTITDFIES